MRLAITNIIGGEIMPATDLRLVSDVDYLDSHTHDPVQTVTVQLDHVLPLFVDAVATNRLWLRDFADATVEISADLYEVLLAYQRMRKAG